MTARVAKELAHAAGAELYEIVPETPYTKADLNWMDQNARSTVEMKDPASRPAIAGTLPDLAGCDVLFIGFPIWSIEKLQSTASISSSCWSSMAATIRRDSCVSPTHCP